MYRPVSVFGLDTFAAHKSYAAPSQSVNREASAQQRGSVNSSNVSGRGLSGRGSAVPLAQSSAPQFLWDLKGLNTSSARAAFRWAVFMTCLAGLPPAYSF
jgi:hypothetical protein